jgi:hypothetical protein
MVAMPVVMPVELRSHVNQWGDGFTFVIVVMLVTPLLHTEHAKARFLCWFIEGSG